jgi:hypothetical protein
MCHHHHYHQRSCCSMMVAAARTLGSSSTTTKSTCLLSVVLLLLSTDSSSVVQATTGFQTWSGHTYNFETAALSSQCDLVLLHSNKFAAGRGMDIHIRTSSSSSKQREHDDDADFSDVVDTSLFSYISDVAVRIGQDVLEVSSHGTYHLNGVLGTSRPSNEQHDEVLAGFAIVHRQLVENDDNRYYFHDIIVESREDDADTDPVIIRLTSHQDACGARILFGENGNNNKIRDEYFGDAVGLLGRYESSTSSVGGGEEMVARNGQTILTDNPHAYGMEWQVRSSSSSSYDDNAFLDPQLFHSNDSSQTCILVASSPSSLSTNNGVSAALLRADDARRHVRQRRAAATITTSSSSSQQAAAAAEKSGDGTIAHAY